MRPPKPNSVEPPLVRTRMPGGVGGVASRGVPLSRSIPCESASRALVLVGALEQALRFARGERRGPFALDRNDHLLPFSRRVEHAPHYRERVEGERAVHAMRAIFADRARHLGK